MTEDVETMGDAEASPPVADAGSGVSGDVVTSGETTCCLLADRPELVPLVTEWMLAEWGADWPGKTPEEVKADVATYACRGELPFAVLAFRGGECVGTAAVRAESTGFPELTPWLVRVYVPPRARRTGAGAAAVRAAEAAAREMGHREMYLICLPDRVSFYAGLGWEIMQTATYHGYDVLVMRTSLA